MKKQTILLMDLQMVSGRIKDLKYFMSELSLSLVLYGQIPTISLTQPPLLVDTKRVERAEKGVFQVFMLMLN